MAALDHWHPVLKSANLRSKPVGVVIDGVRIAVYRTKEGKIGALADSCVHRRARLSLGEVVGEKLQCGYHGWTYDLAGNGESPGTPKMHACARHFETAEKYDYIWVKNPGTAASIPDFDIAGYGLVGTAEYVIEAPLELVLDNFTEVEHTPTTHANFGYELSRMHEVTTRVEADDDSVRVVNTGPQKKTPWFINYVGGLRSGDIFTDDWTTRFSPVYACYDQFWVNPANGKERTDRWRIYVFFNPLDSERTQLVVFSHLRTGSWLRELYIKLARPALNKLVDIEVQCDVRMLESLADKNPSIEGMKLSRFDRVLGMQRDRIESIYRGQKPRRVPTAEAVAEPV
jgi:phenylpropionate dioxygenase-like ring-hydroxylating dioxygenase large terminal subunit